MAKVSVPVNVSQVIEASKLENDRWYPAKVATFKEGKGGKPENIWQYTISFIVGKGRESVSSFYSMRHSDPSRQATDHKKFALLCKQFGIVKFEDDEQIIGQKCYVKIYAKENDDGSMSYNIGAVMSVQAAQQAIFDGKITVSEKQEDKQDDKAKNNQIPSSASSSSSSYGDDDSEESNSSDDDDDKGSLPF